MESKGEQRQTFHYLLSGIALDCDSYDLGQGVTLSRTYVHLMSHPTLAFERPPRGAPHPVPWQAVDASPGITSMDLLTRLSVPGSSGDQDTHHAWATWIALLLRFSMDTTVTITLSSAGDVQKLRCGEARARLLEPIRRPQEGTTLLGENAAWLRDTWYGSLNLSANEALQFAVGAIYHSHRSPRDLGLVSVWAALERLFSSNAAELKFRVCANIAAYLEPPGIIRYELFKTLTELYDARSSAAHGSMVKRFDAYKDSVTIASRAILRIVGLGRVPTKDELERELLCPSAQHD